jgi:hypothetical protein
MTTAAKKGKSSGVGKKTSPASAARVERKKRKGATNGGPGSMPKEEKGGPGKGRKGGGLH